MNKYSNISQHNNYYSLIMNVNIYGITNSDICQLHEVCHMTLYIFPPPKKKKKLKNKLTTEKKVLLAKADIPEKAIISDTSIFQIDNHHGFLPPNAKMIFFHFCQPGLVTNSVSMATIRSICSLDRANCDQ